MAWWEIVRNIHQSGREVHLHDFNDDSQVKWNDFRISKLWCDEAKKLHAFQIDDSWCLRFYCSLQKPFLTVGQPFTEWSVIQLHYTFKWFLISHADTCGKKMITFPLEWLHIRRMKWFITFCKDCSVWCAREISTVKPYSAFHRFQSEIIQI